MTYRSKPQYRSWNVIALGLKTEESAEKTDKIDDLCSKDRQRPRRESWSQPPQRSRGTRGRGTWYLDNRPQTLRRRYTMPNSNDCQDYNYSNSDYDHEVLTSSPEGDNEEDKDNKNQDDIINTNETDREKLDNRNPYYIETSETDREEWKNKNQDEHHRKLYSDNIYRPPKSRSTSYSDDGSQSPYSNSHSNGSKKYELENYKVHRNNNWEKKEFTNNEPDQAWVHDKYESLEDSKCKKDASIHVSPFDLNNKSPTINEKKIDEPDSPIKKSLIINSELPKEITIKFSELTLKESIEETQAPIQENLIDPGVTEEQLPMLINLDEEDNDGSQPIITKISKDILDLDWESYQKALIEEELRLTMERQATQTTTPRKLDTGLKDFDTL